MMFYIYRIDYIMRVILKSASVLPILWFSATWQPGDKKCKTHQSKSICECLERAIWLHQRVALYNSLSVAEMFMNSHLEDKELSTRNCQEQQVFSSCACLIHQILSIAGIITHFSLLETEKYVSLANVISQFNTMLGTNHKRNLWSVSYRNT